jgi:hypothetical protein
MESCVKLVLCMYSTETFESGSRLSPIGDRACVWRRSLSDLSSAFRGTAFAECFSRCDAVSTVGFESGSCLSTLTDRALATVHHFHRFAFRSALQSSASSVALSVNHFRRPQSNPVRNVRPWTTPLFFRRVAHLASHSMTALRRFGGGAFGSRLRHSCAGG